MGGGKECTYVGAGQVKVEAEVGKEYLYKESRESGAARRRREWSKRLGKMKRRKNFKIA